MFANRKMPSLARSALFTLALWSLVFLALGVGYVVTELEPTGDDPQAHSVIFLAISFVLFEGPRLLVALLVVLAVELLLLGRIWRRGRRSDARK